jgi:tetratricopeptide (TPR) repeat protein
MPQFPVSRYLVAQFLCLLLAGFLHSLFALDYLEGRIRELVWLNFSGRAAESFERISNILASDPSNYQAYFIRANCYGWFIASNPENRRYDNSLMESLTACIEHAQKIDESTSEYAQALYFKSLAQVFEAKFKGIRGHNFLSRWATREAKATAEELVGKYPEDIDARLPLGIFHYFWGGSPIWARVAQFTIMLPRGQQELGLEMLEEIAGEGNDSKLWASVVLLYIYIQNSQYEQKALELAERLHNMFPDNAIFQLVLGDRYRGQGRWVLAEAVYRSIVTKVSSRQPGYDEVVFETSRLRAVECQINLSKLDLAFEGVRDILVSNPINPEWVVPWAHLYAARIYRQRGQPQRAERALRYALDGKDYENLHKVARDELEEVRKMIEKETSQ